MNEEQFEQEVEELKEILLQMKAAYPNGYQSLLWEAKAVFEELTDPRNWED